MVHSRPVLGTIWHCHHLPLHICHLEIFLEAAHHKPTTIIQAEHMNSYYFILLFQSILYTLW